MQRDVPGLPARRGMQAAQALRAWASAAPARGKADDRRGDRGTMRQEPAGNHEDDGRDERAAEQRQAQAERHRTAEQIADVVDDFSGEVCVEQFHRRDDGTSQDRGRADEEQPGAPR